LATSSFDEAFSTPSETAATVALRTQQIIAYESGVINTVDPLGGSYYMERLTHEIENKAWDLIQNIEDMGGAIRGIENGFFKGEIEREAYQYQLDIERSKRIIVGLNEFRSQEKMKIETLKVDPKMEKAQVKRLSEIKATRDGTRVNVCLNAVKKCASEERNVIPEILDALKALATIGEICDALKEVYGVYEGVTGL